MTDFRISLEGILAGYSGNSTIVSIPSNVSKIGASAFRNMAVSSVSLPSTTNEIHNSAFADCSQLESISIPGTQKIIADNAFTGSQILSQPHTPSVTTTIVPITRQDGTIENSLQTQIEWQAPSNIPRTITSYNIIKNGQQIQTAHPIAGPEILETGRTHTYQISASDSAGEGVRSSIFSYATTGFPWEESGLITCSPAKLSASANGNLVAIADMSSNVSLYTIQANNNWILTDTLTGTGTVSSVAITGDGKTVIIASTVNINIYTDISGTWTLETILPIQSAQIALSIDGTTLAAGVPIGDGTVFVYSKVNSLWTLNKTLYGTMDSYENFGCSVALSSNGSTLAVGAKYALGKGAVRIFSGWQWSNQNNLYGEEASSEQFGHSISLSSDGKTLAVGSPCMGTLNSQMESMTGYGAVTIWTKQQQSWTKTETIYQNTNNTNMFGKSILLNGCGTTLIAGSATGVSVYAINGTDWPLVGYFPDVASIVCSSLAGDRIFYGTVSAVKSYTYRTQFKNIAPSISTLLRAAVVQDALTAEAAAQSLVSDILQYENSTQESLSSSFITHFAKCLPITTETKKQASLVTLLLVGNLLSETQNDLKSDIADACTQTLQYATDSYITIPAEYIELLVQSAEYVSSFAPTMLYVFFPSSTSIQINSSYKNAIYYLEPDVTYSVGSITLNYHRRSQLQKILLDLPNSNIFTAPFRAPNPIKPLFSADARGFRLENQYKQPSLIESATVWQQKIFESPSTIFNYEIMAWIATDMLLSTDIATREFGQALAAKYIPLARGVEQIAAFNQFGENDGLDYIPTGYFVGAADGSIAYPEAIALNHTTPINRIEAGAFDISIKQLIFNNQVFTVSGGNITLPYGSSRVWSVNLNGPEILLPGAPAYVPSNGIINISANIEYIPPGYFADSLATHIQFQPSPSNKKIVIGANAFPTSSRLCISGTNTTINYYPYSFNGTNTKELTLQSGVFYSNIDSNPTLIWYPAPLVTTDYIATLPNKIRTSSILFGVSGMEFILSPELLSDVFRWTTRKYPILSNTGSFLTYGGFIYSGKGRTPVINNMSSAMKLLQLYDQSYTELPPFTNGAKSSRKSNSIYVTLPTSVKNYSGSMIIIPRETDFTEYVVNDSYIGDILITYRNTPQTPCHFIFTNADLADGQKFSYGNIEWINSSDSSGLRISDIYITPTTTGAVYLMPGACSLYANMFGPWASSIKSVVVYNPSLRITTSIPAYTFKNCINMVTHGFTFNDSIGASAFESCSSLTTPLTISSTGGMMIGANAFKGCSSIPSLIIDCSGEVSIDDNAFAGCSGLSSITIRGRTVSIAGGAFNGCTGVQTINVSNLTSSVSSSFSFATMTWLQSVNISLAGAVTLSTMAGLTSLSSVTITGGSTLTLANNQFAGCTCLQILNISTPLAGMTSSALLACTALMMLSLNFASGASADLNPLTGFTSLASIYITGESALILPSTFCNSLTSLTTVSLTCNTLSSPTDGNMFNGASGLQTLTANVATNPSAETFQINSTLSGLKALSLTGKIIVAGSAFWDNSVLESLTIRGTRNGTLGVLSPSTISIINVNHNVSQSISAYQYMNYQALSSVNITPLLDISEGAFFGCNNMLSFNFNSATSIGDFAFANSGISGEIVIPDTMVSLGSSYFVGCPNLKKITYNCDLVMFNDPTTLEVSLWNKLMYYNVDISGLGNYILNGSATITRGNDLSFNIMFAPSAGGYDIVISNSSLFHDINWANYNNRYQQINELLKLLSTYTDDGRDIVFIKESDASGNIINRDGSGNITIKSNTGDEIFSSGPNCLFAINGGALIIIDESGNNLYNDGMNHILRTIDYPSERTDPSFATGGMFYMDGSAKRYYKYRITNNYTSWITPFILQLQAILDDLINNEAKINLELSGFAGWDGTRFTTLDSYANISLITSQLNTYNNTIYPTAVTYFNAAVAANDNIFATNQTDPSANYAVPFTIPLSNCILKIPQNKITHITGDSDINISGSDVNIYWNKSSPSIVFTDGTIIDISGSLTRRLTENISTEYSTILYWTAQNNNSISDNNSVAISISNMLTSIDDMTNKINTTIDISCGLLTIFDSAMTDYDNTTLNIVSPSISIGNGAFTSWKNGSTLNLTTNTDPFVGVDVFKYSNNIIVNSNKFLINTPEVKLVDFSNITLDDVPTLIYVNTGINASYTRDVEIGTYMPPTKTGFARGYTYIKFQEIPTLKQYILLQKPEDWFWAYHDGQMPYGTTGVGDLKYINNVSGDKIFEQTGLYNNIAPSSFSFMGYRFTRNVHFNSSVIQPNTYFRAIKNNGDVQKKALFRNSGSGRLLYTAAPILIGIAVQLLVIALTVGIGYVLSPLLISAQLTTSQIVAAKTIFRGVMAIVAGSLEIGGVFLTQAANTGVETGVFMLGNLTPIFWIEVAIGALGILGGILKLIKLPGRVIQVMKPAQWGVAKKFPTKVQPKKPRWGDAKKFPVRSPRPKPNIINVVSDVKTTSKSILDDTPTLVQEFKLPKTPELPIPPAKPTGTINPIVSPVERIVKIVDDIDQLPIDSALKTPTINITTKRVPLEGVDPSRIYFLQNNLASMNKTSGTYKIYQKQLDDISKIVTETNVIWRNAELLAALDTAKNLHLVNMMNHMYINNNITSAASAYSIANTLKSRYTIYETPTSPITLNQYSDFNAQITTPILGVLGPSGENYIGNATFTEIEYENAYDKAIHAQYPPYIFPVTGTPNLDVRETNSCYQMSTYQTLGTNYEHPYSTRIPEGYPCKPAQIASPLLINSNYMWKQLYLGSPRTANNLEYNNLWPGNLWHSYDSVIITATENINTEIYLGNRTVEYSSSILERPNLVYSGATNINILIPEGVTSIPNYAFNSTDGTDGTSPFTISSALISPSVTNIGLQAFYRSGIKTIIYPSNATLGAYAFANAPIERVISLSSADSAITHYRDGNYSVSVVINTATKAVTTSGVVALYGFTSAQLSRNGIVVASIPNGDGKWLYLQNINTISETYPIYNNAGGLTQKTLLVFPKQVLSYNINGGALNINGNATYDNIAFNANKTIAQPLIGTNETTSSIGLGMTMWYYFNPTVPYAPFSSFKFNKGATITITFSGVSVVRTGTGVTSTITPRAWASSTNISSYAFLNNESLTHCDISPFCTEIGDSAYEGCKNLCGVIVLPNSLTKLGQNAFAGTNINSIVIPPNVIEIGVGAIPPTTNIVLVPDKDENISPGFNMYCIQPEPITNLIYSASSNVLRELTTILPSSQLRYDLPPLSPVNVNAKSTDSSIIISWENIQVPYSSGATTHRIECSTLTEPTRVFEENINNPFAIRDLTNGLKYTISITAINAAGSRSPTIVSAIPNAC